MLARRHLRIRVLQTLYAFYQHENFDAALAEKELFNGTNRLYDLYLTLLQFFVEVGQQETLYKTDGVAKHMASKQQFFRSLASHPFIKWLAENEKFTKLIDDKKISWQADTEIVRKSFIKIRTSASYKDYAFTEEEISDTDFILKVYKDEIQGSELVCSILEEKNIWWAESLEQAHQMITKTIKNFFANGEKNILPLYKDEEDDKSFMQKLLRETIKNNEELTKLISTRTTNWDVDRIALMDILILKMALTEVMQFNHIPVKVSINEYIDISKDYSTPQSKSFINGVLDKVVDDLKNENRLSKIGRGLIES